MGGFKIKTPKISTPKISTPKISTPKISTPKISTPKISTPKISTPKISTPKISVPKISVKVPEVKMPEVKMPEVKMPEVKMPEVKMPEIPKDLRIPGGYETNKFDLKAQVENGPPPWNVAWAEDITETDAIKGVVAVGVSIVSENPGPFYLWIEDLIDRTISSLISSGKEKFPGAVINEAKELAANIIRQAIIGRNPLETLKQYDTVDFKAGAIKYSGKNKLSGITVSTTWGMKPYVAFRWRGSEKESRTESGHSAYHY